MVSQKTFLLLGHRMLVSLPPTEMGTASDANNAHGIFAAPLALFVLTAVEDADHQGRRYRMGQGAGHR